MFAQVGDLGPAPRVLQWDDVGVEADGPVAGVFSRDILDQVNDGCVIVMRLVHEPHTHQVGVSNLHAIQDDYSPGLLNPFISEMLHAVQQPHRVQGLAAHLLVGQLHMTVKDLDVDGYIMMSGDRATSWVASMDFPLPEKLQPQIVGLILDAGGDRADHHGGVGRQCVCVTHIDAGHQQLGWPACRTVARRTGESPSGPSASTSTAKGWLSGPGGWSNNAGGLAILSHVQAGILPAQCCCLENGRQFTKCQDRGQWTCPAHGMGIGCWYCAQPRYGRESPQHHSEASEWC